VRAHILHGTHQAELGGGGARQAVAVNRAATPPASNTNRITPDHNKYADSSIQAKVNPQIHQNYAIRNNNEPLLAAGSKQTVLEPVSVSK